MNITKSILATEICNYLNYALKGDFNKSEMIDNINELKESIEYDINNGGKINCTKDFLERLEEQLDNLVLSDTIYIEEIIKVTTWINQVKDFMINEYKSSSTDQYICLKNADWIPDSTVKHLNGDDYEILKVFDNNNLLLQSKKSGAILVGEHTYNYILLNKETNAYKIGITWDTGNYLDKNKFDIKKDMKNLISQYGISESNAKETFYNNFKEEFKSLQGLISNPLVSKEFKNNATNVLEHDFKGINTLAQLEESIQLNKFNDHYKKYCFEIKLNEDKHKKKPVKTR